MGTVCSFENMEEGKKLKQSSKNPRVLVCTGWSDTHVAGRIFSSGDWKTRILLTIQGLV